MASAFGLLVQRLPRIVDRVLVVGGVVGARNGSGWFSPGEIADMFELLRLPRPGNISQALADLAYRGLVVRRRSGGSWSVTPLGRDAAVGLVGDVDVTVAEAEIADAGSAELSQGQHPLLPPEMAPVRWLGDIQRFLDAYPFDTNVFCMTRFPGAGDRGDPLTGVIETTRSALGEAGLTMHLASDRNLNDQLFDNIAGHIWACKFGIGLFESGRRDALNENVLIEVGSMLMTGRRCAMLRDRGTPDLPTDFVGHIYKPVDFRDLDEVARIVRDWVGSDLALSVRAAR